VDRAFVTRFYVAAATPTNAAAATEVGTHFGFWDCARTLFGFIVNASADSAALGEPT
jgi:hypothetical protein